MKLTTACFAAVALTVLVLPYTLHGQSIEITPKTILEVDHVITKPVTYHGKKALEVRDAAPNAGDDTSRMVLLKDTTFRNGTIEVSLSGDTAPDAPANLRGFVGIAFHIGTDRTRYECFYLRPKNGRSSDPVQRTHSTQYVSQPEFTWNRLRTETPGKYESYVDLVPGEWTHVRIQITDKHASLFVNDAKEPTLVVNDLKGTVDKGPIALWIGPGTIANFAELKIKTAN
ncbi:MAG TPA: hypothetical protein VL495_09210 [Edaphobacter sp.]|jgi:hypothetical protein|nr:hypothetical protein [Edaphobacter sp.]